MNHRCTHLARILIIASVASPSIARADDIPAITAGFRPHVLPQKGGGIDWTAGEIIAEGIGKVRSNLPADRLGAQRAAELVAARNALAIANGIHLDADGRVANLQNGRITVEGLVKGQRIVETSWDNAKNPPECHVKSRVPLWGATGICTIFCESQKRVCIQRGGRRLVLVQSAVDVSDAVLVIDARGIACGQCLFPSVAATDGAVLYDVATRSDPNATTLPPVRYVESDISYENLSASLNTPAPTFTNHLQLALLEPRQTRARLFHHPLQYPAALAFLDSAAHETQDHPASQPTSDQAASQPASQPATRPYRRRVVVKAVSPAPGNPHSQIVLTKEDAEKLRQSPEGAALLRTGQVIIVVDSAAAGMQGRLPEFDPQTILASSAP